MSQSVHQLLKALLPGDYIYIDKVSQPYKVIAANNDFIIAIRPTFETRHIAFDLNNHQCGYFVNFNQTLDFSNPDEVDKALHDLSTHKRQIMREYTRITDQVIRSIKSKGQTIYGKNNVLRPNY